MTCFHQNITTLSAAEKNFASDIGVPEKQSLLLNFFTQSFHNLLEGKKEE
jgi:ethanolamine ammonia-lyase large subunit